MSHVYIKIFSSLGWSPFQKCHTQNHPDLHIKKYTMFAFLSHFWHLGAGRRAVPRVLSSRSLNYLQAPSICREAINLKNVHLWPLRTHTYKQMHAAGGTRRAETSACCCCCCWLVALKLCRGGLCGIAGRII
jgi:hypothetical protein